MPRDARRSDRVAEAIREGVAMFLSEGGGVKDPRITGLVTVTGAEVTRDLRHAKIFVSILGSESERASTFEGLQSLAGYLRAHLGRALHLRLAPEIVFRHDDSVAYAARIESLLETVRHPEPPASAGSLGVSTPNGAATDTDGAARRRVGGRASSEG
jgi:ribosome-binding factor A